METKNKEPAPESLNNINNLFNILLNNSEGRILITGIGTALLYIIIIFITFIFNPQISRRITLMTISHIIAGRLVGLTVGYTGNLGHHIVISLNMIIETVMVLIFYPLFVLSWKKLIDFKILKKFNEEIKKTAESRQNFIRKSGVISLLIFVWFPFWMTGPIIGCAIGFLIGLRAWVNLTVVLSGTFLAIITQAIFLKEFQNWIKEYGSYASIIFVVTLVLLVIIGQIIQRIYYKKKSENISDKN